MGIQIFQHIFADLINIFPHSDHRICLQFQIMFPETRPESCSSLKKIKNIQGICHIFYIPAASFNKIINTIPRPLHASEGNAMILIPHIIVIYNHRFFDHFKWFILIRKHLCCIQYHSCYIIRVCFLYCPVNILCIRWCYIGYTHDISHISGFPFKNCQAVRTHIQLRISDNP